jgi:uncharacterized protein (DUF302 family)
MTPYGLRTCESSYAPKDTIDRFAAAVTAHGMSILARIDQAAAAAKVGTELQPTEVLIFGSARVGTPLMQVAQTIGIDLPLKAVVWEDAAGKTWIAYNHPDWLAERHDNHGGTDRVLAIMADTLATCVTAATSGVTGARQ